MVASLFASTIVGAELQAQKLPPTAADSAAILKATVPSGGRVQFMDIAGDTAIVVGMIVRVRFDTLQNKGGALETVTRNFFDDFRARVERRAGKWVLVRRKRT
jgi:hypothetical protein